ncbi:hypothetical protein [Cryptosporangium sp. NPDC048952]|uniref:hypothetical protein n=1 Tax=Cryptosporangium sp. NPDC048952 TaxID=3363961 RepID=UPI0037175C35
MESGTEQQKAAEALAAVEAHQARTRRAARLPWWYYLATFVLIAVGSAANDFVTLDGARLLAGAVLTVLVAVLVFRLVAGASLLGRARGVELPSPDARAFVVVVILGVAGGLLVVGFGDSVVQAVADSIGLRDYPYTVAGVLFGAVFTGLFALSQLLTARFRPGR